MALGLLLLVQFCSISSSFVFIVCRTTLHVVQRRPQLAACTHNGRKARERESKILAADYKSKLLALEHGRTTRYDRYSVAPALQAINTHEYKKSIA